ncbi:MAG TPA: MOSC N-terminal beta barrel domain-containing protein [Methylocella sp.]|nr:MOSC N-terminal beta barrel domain-containing protein [Methylocella sp.]
MGSLKAARVTKLRIYPVKGLQGSSHNTAFIEPWGFSGDRRWMVVDARGRFLTQRELHHMALVSAANTPSGITLSSPAMGSIEIAFPTPAGEMLDVIVWRDTVAAAAAGSSADAWMSSVLGVSCRLVYLADTKSRQIAPTFGRPGQTVNFADGFPVLLVSLSSLDDLNRRLIAPVPIERFRPNIVIEGAPAWEEDRWRQVRIGGVLLRIVKPCSRCIVTTIDPETGERPHANEPLAALSKFRRDQSGGAMFGQNLIPEATGRIAVGDDVEIIETGPSNVRLLGSRWGSKLWRQ